MREFWPLRMNECSPDASPLGILPRQLDASIPRLSPQAIAPVLNDLAVVSEDGKFIAAAMKVADGARANDNIAIGIFDVDADRMVDKVVIVDANEPEKPGRAARESHAHAVLAQRRWRPLQTYNMRTEEPAVGVPVPRLLAEGEDLRVRYLEPNLIVSDTKAPRELLRTKVSRFSFPDGARCKGCPQCPAPLAILKAVFGDRAQGVLLLVIHYSGGTDVCWEPDESFHVLRIPLNAGVAP